jgi:hypothetical protein
MGFKNVVISDFCGFESSGSVSGIGFGCYK